jgi:uncharacterized protein (TIGR02118 family)
LIVVFVTYQGHPQTRFDRTYYVERHLPLVMAAWEKYGLDGVVAYFPAVEQHGTIAICECRFTSETAMNLAFSSPETPAVMADIGRFTDVEPTRVLAIPVRTQK